MSALNQWFKFYGAEYRSDPKMDRLSVQERSCWLTILCMASQDDGTVRFLSVESLLTKSGVRFNPYDSKEWDDATSVLQTFEQLEMIKIDSKGIIHISNWEKRQNTSQSGYERVKKCRENKAKLSNDNEMITHDNANDNDRGDKIRGDKIRNTNTVAKAPSKTVRPTLEEVKEYCESRNNKIDPQAFLDSNDSKGWVTGKARTPIKDWKATVRTWENFRKSQMGSNISNVLKTDQTEQIIKHAKSKTIQA